MALATAVPQIRPISDLRTKLPEIEAIARETREPIVMTKNGMASMVLFDIDAYNEHLQHERAVLKLREAEIEAKYHADAISYDDVRARIDDIIGTAERAYAQR